MRDIYSITRRYEEHRRDRECAKAFDALLTHIENIEKLLNCPDDYRDPNHAVVISDDRFEAHICWDKETGKCEIYKLINKIEELSNER